MNIVNQHFCDELQSVASLGYSGCTTAIVSVQEHALKKAYAKGKKKKKRLAEKKEENKENKEKNTKMTSDSCGALRLMPANRFL